MRFSSSAERIREIRRYSRGMKFSTRVAQHRRVFGRLRKADRKCSGTPRTRPLATRPNRSVAPRANKAINFQTGNWRVDNLPPAPGTRWIFIFCRVFDSVRTIDSGTPWLLLLLLLLLLVINIRATVRRRLFPFLSVFIGPNHTGPVVSVMCDLWRRIRRAHGIPPRRSHVLHCFDPYESAEKPSLHRFRSLLSTMQSCAKFTFRRRARSFIFLNFPPAYFILYIFFCTSNGRRNNEEILYECRSRTSH